MSENKHSPEPWRVNDEHAVDADGEVCADGSADVHLPTERFLARGDANLRRIVACVNACAGIPTEALEAGALKAALEALHEAASYADTVTGLLAKTCPGKAEALTARLGRAAAALRALGRLT